MTQSTPQTHVLHGSRLSFEDEVMKFATEQWGEKTWEGLSNKMAEETGEIAGAVVKIPEGRATMDDLDKELGDALIVLAQFASKRGTTLQALLGRAFTRIKKKASASKDKKEDDDETKHKAEMSQWAWMVDWCREKRLSPFSHDNWQAAGKAYKNEVEGSIGPDK